MNTSLFFCDSCIQVCDYLVDYEPDRLSLYVHVRVNRSTKRDNGQS